VGLGVRGGKSGEKEQISSISVVRRKRKKDKII
jgi:hypothetical protein